jgi:hypothetical protein
MKNTVQTSDLLPPDKMTADTNSIDYDHKQEIKRCKMFTQFLKKEQLQEEVS